MPQVVSDIVDVYVFRRLNARVQFLLLQRRRDVTLGQTWQSFHTRIAGGETTIQAAQRAVRELAGLNVSAAFSADYVNQFYDDTRDVLVLAPVLAVNVNPQAPVRLDPELRDCAWLDRDEATVRLPFSGQRWAVRHIDEIMSIGHSEADLYRLSMPASTQGDRAAVETSSSGDEVLASAPGWTAHAADETGNAASAAEVVGTEEGGVASSDDAGRDEQTTSPTMRTDVRSEAE